MTGVNFLPDSTKEYGYPSANPNTNAASETYFPKEKVSPNASGALAIGTIYDSDTNIHFGIQAKYAPDSTPDEPVINVTIQKSGGQTETHAVHIHNINTMSATDMEMFALCAYADDMGFGTGGSFGSWNTLKTCSENAELNGYGSAAGTSTRNFATQKKNWNKIITRMTSDYADAGMYQQVLDGKALLNMFDAAGRDLCIETLDWRTMNCASWDKLLKNVDDFIEAYRERLKAVQDAQLKAAQKAARLAPASHQATAAQAAWSMAGAMLAIAPQSSDTKLPAASAAAAYTEAQPQPDTTQSAVPDTDSGPGADTGAAAQNQLTKYQEYMLTGKTTAGITETDGTTEVVGTGTGDEKKTWYITVFTQDGIACRACTPGEDSVLLWQVNYKNKAEYEKVQDFLKRFEKEEDLTFASSEKFWKDFLNDKIEPDDFYSFFERSSSSSFDYGISDGDSLYVDKTKAAYSAYLSPSIFHESVYSMTSLATGERINVYKSDDYSDMHPVYVVMGKDDKGNPYRQEINVNEVDVHNCSCLELAAFNAHLYGSSMSPEMQLGFLTMQQAAGVSFGARTDYAAVAQQLSANHSSSGGNFTNVYQNWLEQLSLSETDGQIPAAGKASADFKPEENFFDREDLLRNIAPNAPEAVVKAWQEAAKETGVDGLGRTADGKVRHISQMMVERAVQWVHNRPHFNNLLGNTITSALHAAQQASYGLDHPLNPAAEKSQEVQEQIQKEREFYKHFIDKLSPLL